MKKQIIATFKTPVHLLLLSTPEVDRMDKNIQPNYMLSSRDSLEIKRQLKVKGWEKDIPCK